MRSRSRSSREGSPVSGAECRRRRLRTRWTVAPDQRSGASRRSTRRRRAKSATKTTAPTIVAWTRPGRPPPRMIAGTASTGSAEHGGEDEQVDRGQAGDVGRPSQPGLHEHPVLERGADRAAAGRDLRQRVAGELRGDHRGHAGARMARCWSAHRQASVATCRPAIAPSQRRAELVEVAATSRRGRAGSGTRGTARRR